MAAPSAARARARPPWKPRLPPPQNTFEGLPPPAPTLAHSLSRPRPAADQKKAAEGEDEGEDGAGGDPEAECQAQFKPIVELPEVATTTGEEDEDVLIDMCDARSAFCAICLRLV